MRHRLITFLVFGAILVGIAEWDLKNRKIGPIQSLNDWWLELCVANTRDKISDPAVTFVRINDEYEPLEDLGLGEEGSNGGGDAPKNLSRLDYATILGALQQLKPKSVAFAPVPEFDGNSLFNQTDIEPLKKAASTLPRLTLGSIVSETGDAGGPEYPTLAHSGDFSKVREIKRTVRSPDSQLLANGDPAFTRFEDGEISTENGTVRIPLIARQGDKVVPSFGLLALLNTSEVAVDNVTVTIEADKKIIQVGDKYTIPIDEFGTMIVPAYAGLKNKMISNEGKDDEAHHFVTLTANQVHIPGEDDDVAREFIAKFQRELNSISENLVIIGFDRNIDRQFKLQNGDQLSRAGLFARAIATIQSGRYIEWWPNWLRWIGVLAVVGLAFIVFKFHRSKAAVFGLLGSLVILVALVVIFKGTLSWTPPFAIISLLVLLILVSVILPDKPAPPVEKPDES